MPTIMRGTTTHLRAAVLLTRLVGLTVTGIPSAAVASPEVIVLPDATSAEGIAKGGRHVLRERPVRRRHLPGRSATRTVPDTTQPRARWGGTGQAACRLLLASTLSALSSLTRRRFLTV